MSSDVSFHQTCFLMDPIDLCRCHLKHCCAFAFAQPLLLHIALLCNLPWEAFARFCLVLRFGLGFLRLRLAKHWYQSSNPGGCRQQLVINGPSVSNFKEQTLISQRAVLRQNHWKRGIKHKEHNECLQHVKVCTTHNHCCSASFPSQSKQLCILLWTHKVEGGKEERKEGSTKAHYILHQRCKSTRTSSRSPSTELRKASQLSCKQGLLPPFILTFKVLCEFLTGHLPQGLIHRFPRCVKGAWQE